VIWPRRLRPGSLWPGSPATRPAAPAGQQTDPALTGVSSGEYRSLVRLAALLLHDPPAAEDLVQEACVAVRAGQLRPRDTGKALTRLRREVVSRSRSVLRRRAVAGRAAPSPAPDRPRAQPGGMTLPGHPALLAALRGLSCRQREAIVLRYYADLPEAEIAASMGVSKGAVRHHTARGLAVLKPVLEHDVP
jgi:DNA-directed RNA polymerase specialized sigma24 family protein